MSVDGFLARPDDALDFLHTGEQESHGFKEFLASVDVVVIGRRTFDVVLKLGHLALYGKKPVVVVSSRPLDFSSVKGGVVEQMSGEPAEIVKQLKSRGFKHAYSRLYRRRHHDSAIPRGRMHRPDGDHARASADRSGHPVIWPSAARHQPSPRCNAQL